MVSFKTLKLCTELGCKVGKAKPPKFNIGTVTKPIENVASSVEHTAPSFTIGAKRAEQTTREMTGATQLAEQNRAFMQSGNNSIIGHYLTNEGATYYYPAIQFGPKVKPTKWTVEDIPYTRQGANVTLTYREGVETLPFNDPNILKGISGYTDSNGNVLPYIFLDSLEVQSRGNGLGRAVMEDIKRIARDKCGGRLILQPGNEFRNPSPFYYKCGLRSTTKEGADEILAYLNNGTPFKSGSSAPMYLPIE